jgi:predicted metal-dependent hydrolase
MTPVVPPEEFWQGVEQFNQQEFYACHDTLEALWMEAFDPQKRFYQGVLQIAVACYHLGNLNWRGAVILLGEGIGRLRDYQPVYEGIDVTELLTQSIQLLKALQEAGPEQVADFVKQLAAAETNCAGESSGNAVGRLPKILRVAPTINGSAL